MDTSYALLASDTPPHANLASASAMLNVLYSHSSKFVQNPSLKLYYVTTGSWNSPAPLVSKIADSIQRFQDTNMLSKVDFYPWGATQIQDNWRAIDSAAETTVQFDQRTTLPDMPGIREAYLGVLPGEELVKLVSDDEGEIRKSLFFDNVRDFQGDNGSTETLNRLCQAQTQTIFVCLIME